MNSGLLRPMNYKNLQIILCQSENQVNHFAHGYCDPSPRVTNLYRQIGLFAAVSPLALQRKSLNLYLRLVRSVRSGAYAV